MTRYLVLSAFNSSPVSLLATTKAVLKETKQRGRNVLKNYLETTEVKDKAVP
jgi:hypothetical protein